MTTDLFYSHLIKHFVSYGLKLIWVENNKYMQFGNNLSNPHQAKFGEVENGAFQKNNSVPLCLDSFQLLFANIIANNVGNLDKINYHKNIICWVLD